MEVSVRQIHDDVMRLIDRCKRCVDIVAEAQGLTKVQLFALYLIDHHGDLAMGQVAAVLHCDASNVTGIIDRLVAQGLVKRTESERDRRTKKIHLTPKGEQMVAQLQAAMPDKLGCSRLSAEERTSLHTILQKMTAGPFLL